MADIAENFSAVSAGLNRLAIATDGTISAIGLLAASAPARPSRGFRRHTRREKAKASKKFN